VPAKRYLFFPGEYIYNIFSGIARGKEGAAKMGMITAIIRVITAIMEVVKGHQSSHDFWGWQNCSPPPAPITHAMPLH